MEIETIITSIIIFISIYFSVYFLIVWKSCKKDDPKPKKFPKITVLIPACNEEKNIESTINSCLNQDYPKDKLKILVVNDGSTDRTREICEKIFVKKGLIKLINKRNTGKANSMNIALKEIDTDYFCLLDADSYLEKNALKKMIGYFDDKNVGAVVSSVNIKKHKGFLNYFQAIEYMITDFFRKILSTEEAMYMVNGAGTIFRTKAVKQLGGFDEKNETEDLEMALKLVKNGYKIKTSFNGFSFTYVPRSLKELFKQRLRWYTGFFRNTYAYRDLIFNPKYGLVGLFALPLNGLWTIALIYLLITISYQLIWNAYNAVLTVSYVGLQYLIENYHIFFAFTTVFTLTVIALVTFLPLYYIIVRRKKSFLVNVLTYFFYIVIYVSINGLIYIVALLKSFRGAEGWTKISEQTFVNLCYYLLFIFYWNFYWLFHKSN